MKMNDINITEPKFPNNRAAWQCPRCGRIFAPHVSECHYCNNERYPRHRDFPNRKFPPDSPLIPEEFY